MKKIITILTFLLIIGGIIIAGCTKYADPELKITSNSSKISEDATTGNITYDISLVVANVGTNNAYQVKMLTILSTPKDLPEYRFTSKNTDVGEINKGVTKTFTERMILPTTKSNYDLIIAGSKKPEIETKLTSVTSNVMG